MQTLQTLLIVLLCAFALIGSLVIIVASLTRCRHCGRWHEDPEEEMECEQRHSP